MTRPACDKGAQFPACSSSRLLSVPAEPGVHAGYHGRRQIDQAVAVVWSHSEQAQGCLDGHRHRHVSNEVAAVCRELLQSFANRTVDLGNQAASVLCLHGIGEKAVHGAVLRRVERLDADAFLGLLGANAAEVGGECVPVAQDTFAGFIPGHHPRAQRIVPQHWALGSEATIYRIRVREKRRIKRIPPAA